MPCYISSFIIVVWWKDVEGISALITMGEILDRTDLKQKHLEELKPLKGGGRKLEDNFHFEFHNSTLPAADAEVKIALNLIISNWILFLCQEWSDTIVLYLTKRWGWFYKLLEQELKLLLSCPSQWHLFTMAPDSYVTCVLVQETL